MARSVCRIKDCTELVVGQKLCRKHYMRLWRKGSTTDRRQNARGKCKVRGCNEPHAAKGLCEGHYRTLHNKKHRAESRQGRKCEFCSKAIPSSRNARAIFCSTDCKERAQNEKAKRRHPERMRWYLRFQKYGITQPEYEALLLWQGGRCAICWTDEPKGRGSWHVDHCHDTKAIRGLLCNECNTGLGKFKDKPELVERALSYLKV